MTICFFGSYDPVYARNKILIDGLQKNGARVLHCRSNAGSVFTRYPELISQFLKIKDQVDVIYVAFVGHLNVPLAWILGKLFNKNIIFDMFYSMYDTYVFDRRSARSGSFRARSYFLIDKLSAMLADRVVTDTQAHANYFVNLLKLPKRKFHCVFVGGDDTLFTPGKRKVHNKIRVIFHGMFTRLHGAEYFVEAAKLLEKEKNLELILVGSSQNYTSPIQLYKKLKPKSLTYYPEMSISKLAGLLADCDISVGHLGTTVKAKSVITNKMFQAMASRVAVVAGDCAANLEVFTQGKNAWFVEMGDPKSLAEALRFLSHHAKVVKKLADNGYRYFKIHLTNEQIGKRLIQVIQQVD